MRPAVTKRDAGDVEEALVAAGRAAAECLNLTGHHKVYGLPVTDQHPARLVDFGSTSQRTRSRAHVRICATVVLAILIAGAGYLIGRNSATTPRRAGRRVDDDRHDRQHHPNPTPAAPKLDPKAVLDALLAAGLPVSNGAGRTRNAVCIHSGQVRHRPQRTARLHPAPRC
jgi:hypothetical protein